jgi:hypothetical protein
MSDANDDGLAPPPLSEEEAAFRASFALLVDFYRVEQRGHLLRAFLPATLFFVPMGGLVVIMSLSSRVLSAGLVPFIATLGLVLLAAGPLSAIVLLLRSMGADAYVAIRIDGLAIKPEPRLEEELLPWDQIEDARFRAEPAVVAVLLRDGSERLFSGPFAEVSLSGLAEKIRDARRLAVWNRLVPRACQ